MGTYSFLDVKAVISGPGGSFSIGSDAGAAEEGITAEYNEDKNTMTAGAGGDVMHSLHAANLGTITIRLLKTSPVNAQLSALYNLQTQNGALHGQNVITVRDVSRGDVITGKQAAFKKHTGLTYAKDGNMNEWAFDVGNLNMLLGAGRPDVNV